MTIEFSCQHCKKILKTSDDKAGRKAKCPQCGEPVDVPMPKDIGSDDLLAIFDDLDIETPIREEQSFLAEEGTNCQMCGTLNPSRSLVCNACGEVLLKSGIKRNGMRPQHIRVGKVFSRSWELYKQNLGMCLAAPFLASLLSTLAVGFIVGLAVVFYVASSIVFQNIPLAQMGILAVLVLLVIPLVIITISYFEIGKHLVLLKISLGEKPGIGELFSGRPFLGRMILCSMLFELVVGFGNAIFVLIGFFLTLFFWPYPFLLIDQNLPGVDAFVKSTKITSGNLLSVALIILSIFCLVILIPTICIGAGFLLVKYAGVSVAPLLGLGIFLAIFASVFVYTFQLLVKAVTYVEMT
ncbi:MAG: hypothetical protein QM501_14585 [Gimesia sp.]